MTRAALLVAAIEAEAADDFEKAGELRERVAAGDLNTREPEKRVVTYEGPLRRRVERIYRGERLVMTMMDD